MKKTLLFSAICSVIIAACGSSHKETSIDSDSMAIVEELPLETVATSEVAYVTKDSIGHIFVGMPMHEVPDSIPHLYSNKENGASEDAVTITFLDGEREKFIAYDFGEGNIDVLNVIGTNVKVKTPNGNLGIGDQFAKILDLPGVETEWSGYDGTGSWYWIWNGIWFAPSQETLTEQLSKHLYDYHNPPTSEDFSDEIKIGFIGTGLPF